MMSFLPAALLSVAVLGAAPAAAQTMPELLACARIARDADRLACFDAAVAKSSAEARRISEARAAESARIAKEEAAAAAAAAAATAAAQQQAKREAFGKVGPDPDDVQEVETQLSEVLTNASGLGVFVLANGQMWRQVDTVALPRWKEGDAVKLTRGSLGGFRLNFLRQKRWVTVKRMR